MFNWFAGQSISLRTLAARARALYGGRRGVLLSVAGLGVVLFLTGAFWIRDEARQTLARERARLAGYGVIPFERVTRPPLKTPEVRFWQNTENTRAIARFKDSYFAATDGGLVQYSADGNVARHFTVLDGLGESDLVSLAVFDSKLFIGTATEGLLAFDGDVFESYRWRDREPQVITALLPDNGRLLIGTFAGGLIEFDGKKFTELNAGAEKSRLRRVNCLAKDGSRLYVGTFDDGLWILEAGRWLHFRAEDGLASDRVVGVVAIGDTTFVASDFGVSAARAADLAEVAPAGQKAFRVVATLPALCGLVKYRGRLLLSKDDGEILSLDPGSGAPGGMQVKAIDWPKPADLSGCRLAVVDEKLWLAGSRGIWQTGDDGLARVGESAPQTIASNVVSALAVASDGAVWAGNFRRGIDVLSSDGKPLAHLESEAVREVNFLLPEAGAGSLMLAATSQGLVRFDSRFHSANLTKADGLPGNSIMQITATADPSSRGTGSSPTNDLVLATGRGLATGQQGKWRTWTTTQGLPGNQIYTTLFFKGALFVGTLGGLARIESNHVVRVFTDSNSRLTPNWVTGLCAARDRLFIATYGGGVFELPASNELQSFAGEIGRPVVNPNAMWSDGEMLVVGTLDGAWVLDLNLQKWTHLRDVLPSKMVLSIAGDEKYVYFGTTSGIARVEKKYLKDGDWSS